MGKGKRDLFEGGGEDEILAPPVLTVVEVPAPQELETTVKDFAQGSNSPLYQAFAHEEKLKHGTRKLPLSQWKAAFKAFLSTER
jgi:hypothetical protein